MEAAWPRVAPDGSGFAYLSGRTDLILASPDGTTLLRNCRSRKTPCFSCRPNGSPAVPFSSYSDWDYE
ncbi:MAG: hypothetical protein R2991_08610 [Thermoanaerobaculia bacterium]